MVELEDIRVGSVVMVRPNFGAGFAQRVIVEEVEEDVKNGIPGIGYGDHWAYLHQVVEVVKY